MSLTPRIVHSDDVYRLAHWQNVVIVDVAGDVDVGRMKQLGQAHRDLVAQFPAGIVTCAIIREQTPVASREARDESAKFIRELGDAIIQQAMVVEQQGVMAQIMRTVVRGLNVLTRNTKMVLYGSVDEAVASVSRHVARPRAKANMEAELRAAIAAVREGYAPRTPMHVGAR